MIAIPFILVFCFADRARGFLWILLSSIAFAVIVALGTESLHIFAYSTVFTIYALADIVILAVFLHRKKNFKGLAARPPLLIARLLALAIIGLELVSVHYNYTGPVQTIRGGAEVEHSSYGYPTFSDEWVEAALANYSIETRGLPTVNPLAGNAPTVNILLPFDSLVALLFLILGLSPAAHFAVLAVGFGILLCLLLYLALRRSGISRSAALIAMLSVPFITNGANLPGIWFLLPYTAGLAAFLIMLSAAGTRDYPLTLFAGLLSVVLYPPMMVFCLPVLLAILLKERAWLLKVWPKTWHRNAVVFKVAALFAFLLILFAVLALYFILFNPSSGLSLAIKSGFFHPNLDGGIVSYGIWNIVPISLLPFVVIGIFAAARKKLWHILAPAAVGLAYWIFYAYYLNVIIIEYPRIVMITSFLLIMIAAAGVEYVLALLLRSFPFLGRVPISLVAVLFFLIPLYSYPLDSGWQKLVLTEIGAPPGHVIIPAAPINRYLVPDDLAIWKGINAAIFTAPPWKGLVIGAATGNFPLETKSAVMTTDIMPYAEFAGSSCLEKTALARRYRITYAYSEPFDCPAFLSIATSSEGLVLYRAASSRSLP